jgi:hypothetical protein
MEKVTDSPGASEDIWLGVVVTSQYSLGGDTLSFSEERGERPVLVTLTVIDVEEPVVVAVLYVEGVSWSP